MTRFFPKIAALALLAGSISHTDAVTITSLFNTGVNTGGTTLSDNSVDPHYTVDGFLTGPHAFATTSAQGYPVGPWIGDNSLSTWLSPTVSASGMPWAVYTYTTTFNLTGLDPLSAFISGQWAADDGGGLSDIFLNGVSTGFSSGGFASWTAFSLSSGFQPGVNTLSFRVQNTGGGPTGVRVEMAGTANAVPDGGPTVGLLGLGLVGVETLRRRLAKRRAL